MPEMPKSVPLQDYFLRYRGAQSDSVPTKPNEHAIAPTLNSYVLDNLTPNTTYHISLAARTSYGVGVAAQIKVRTESNDLNDRPTDRRTASGAYRDSSCDH
ncbi:unnamed protein product [Echinostoma caproni]|uniref:Fibronectin type-III domain-containing protein n=1 Tax=Echinostoma caproni TaxID=27848 RepID=A0A183A386_9TREM|nr:unnamed protein product [Echinostoma caproni]